MPPGGTPKNQISSYETPTSSNRTKKKETLHYLAASSSTTAVDAARALLERGANPRAVDKDGLTPLHFACAHDNVAMTQLLLTFGCDPMTTDKMGRTALSVAKGNTLRFLRRYQKKDKTQRMGIFRRFFACHSQNNSTFFIVRENNGNGTVSTGMIHPTALATASSVSFNRGNAITRSYRHAKKKIRQTLHVFGRNGSRSRSNSDVALRDVVLTSEGLRTVETPSREEIQTRKTKRSMSTSELYPFSALPEAKKDQNNRGRRPAADNVTPSYTKGTKETPRRGRSKTPDLLGSGTVAAKVNRHRRSRSQERILDANCLKAPVAFNPMSYYHTDKARAAGLRPQPSAPPLTPEMDRKNEKKTRSRSRSQDGGLNSTTYYTADENSIDILDKKIENLKLSDDDKKKKKTPKRKESDDDDDYIPLVDPSTPVTPTTVDDGEIRKIRRMRDAELRCELKKYGISPAGPLDAKVRRLYEKKLLSERQKISSRGYSPDIDTTTLKYSPQLELALKYGGVPVDIVSRSRKHDEVVRNEFSGDGYSAFCYLIMDPRILGENVDSLSFNKFVESIFYVGKGSKNRPLAHFIDARNERRENPDKVITNEKLRRIDELWSLGHGIPRHEIAHGISDEEAFVREASLIEAIKLTNLSNKKGGEFHGITKQWDSVTRAEFGVFLLNRAMTTLKAEGVRLIHEKGLPDSLYPYVNNRRGANGNGPKTSK